MADGFSPDLLRGTPQMAYRALERFSWLTEQQRERNKRLTGDPLAFAPSGTTPLELRALVEEFNSRQISPLSEAEEQAFIEKEFRARGMNENRDSFKALIQVAHKFVASLSRPDLLRFGNLAGLRTAGDIGPSESIMFRAEPLPRAERFSLAGYQDEVGGPLVLGARLLWWCAAAEIPAEFGYSDWHSHLLKFHPFWISYVGVRGKSIDSPALCRLEEHPVQLMRSSAARLLITIETQSSATLNAAIKSDAPSVARPDGFDQAGNLWRGGVNLTLALAPLHLKILEVLFAAPSYTMDVVEFCKAVWGEKYQSHVRSCSSDFSKLKSACENFGIEVKRKNKRVVMVLS